MDDIIAHLSPTKFLAGEWTVGFVSGVLELSVLVLLGKQRSDSSGSFFPSLACAAISSGLASPSTGPTATAAAERWG